jgi:nicotinamide riboside kinase
MEKEVPLVITLVGAESSGKTVLAKQLAEALSCPWVPEYAREYLEKLGRPYEFEDLEAIARGQWEMEADFRPNLLKSPLPPSPLEGEREFHFNGSMASFNAFIDKIRSLGREVVKYGRQVPFVEEVMNQDPTSLYLLCRPKMEWESDPLREAPILIDRVWIYNQYLKELVVQGFDFRIIS